MATADPRGGPANEIFLQRLTINQNMLAADAVNRIIFRAGFPCKVLAVYERHSVVGGAACAATVRKVAAGVTAPGSGADLLTTTLDLTAAINTEQTGALTATAANLALTAGDCLAISLTGTQTGLVGFISVVLMRID